MDIYGYFRMVQNRHSPHSFHPKTSQNQSSPCLGSHPTPGRRVCRCHPRRQWSPSALRFFYRPEMTAVNSVHFFSSTPTYLGIISLVKDPFFPTQSQEKYWRGLRSPNAVWLYNKEMQNVNMWGCAKWIPICVHCMIFNLYIYIIYLFTYVHHMLIRYIHSTCIRSASIPVKSHGITLHLFIITGLVGCPTHIFPAIQSLVNFHKIHMKSHAIPVKSE